MPQSAHAHGGAKFKRPRSIFSSSLDCGPKAAFGALDVIVLAAFAFVALQKEVALQPMNFRLPGSLSMLAHKGECLIHRAQTLGDFPRAQTCISELGD